MSAVLLALLVAGLGFAGIAAAASRPHTRVEIASGSATLTRGALPPGLLSDLRDVARHAPQAEGAVELRGQLDTLKITVRDLPEDIEQRVRNVVLLKRRQIRRP